MSISAGSRASRYTLFESMWRDAEAVMALATAMLEIRDDLEARHGEAGADAFRSSLFTAHAVITRAD